MSLIDTKITSIEAERCNLFSRVWHRVVDWFVGYAPATTPRLIRHHISRSASGRTCRRTILPRMSKSTRWPAAVRSLSSTLLHGASNDRMLNVPVAVRRRPRSDFSPNDRRTDLVGSVNRAALKLLRKFRLRALPNMRYLRVISISYSDFGFREAATAFLHTYRTTNFGFAAVVESFQKARSSYTLNNSNYFNYLVQIRRSIQDEYGRRWELTERSRYWSHRKDGSTSLARRYWPEIGSGKQPLFNGIMMLP